MSFQKNPIQQQAYPATSGYAPVVVSDLDSSINRVPVTVVAPSAPAMYATNMYPLQPSAVFEVSQNNVSRHWKIDLCETGDCQMCMYSYFCAPCALADARTSVDGSNWYVNCAIMHPVSTRWLIRTAYNIPGNAHDDCWSGAFLPCCAVNQFLQTTKVYGKAQEIPQVGPEFNTNPRLGINQRPFENLIYDVGYSLLCNRCAIGYAMETVGMPFWFGACCVGVFEANSILRYHNRNRPLWDNECYPDVVLPFICMSINNHTAYATMVVYSTGMLAESNTKAGRTYCYGCNCWWGMNLLHQYCQQGCICTDNEGRYLVNH